MRIGKELIACAIAFSALGISALPAMAQSWPTRPVRLMVTLGPGSGADIGDSLRLPQLGHLEAGEAVDDMHLPGALVGDRAQRGRILAQQLEDPLQCPAGRGRELRARLAHSVISGATTTQRCGSSPSVRRTSTS